MSEEPPKPMNQEDVQALDELRKEAVTNGNLSEQADAFNQQAESVGVDSSQRYGDHDPSSGQTYKEYLEQGGSSGAQLRAAAAAERSASQPETIDKADKDLLDQAWSKIGNDMRARTDELEASGMTRQEAGAQAIDEFWGPKDSSATTPNDRSRANGELRPSEPKDVAKALADNPEAMDPDNEDGVGLAAIASIGQEPWTVDVPNKDESPVEGPVEPPVEGPVEPPIEGPVEPPVEGPVEPPVEGPKGPIDRLLPEIAKSPELFDAEAELEIARDEYARIKHGREGSTFFSIKFSKRKLEAAKHKYEETKARAEDLASDYLERRGLSPESQRSAKNFGRFFEETKLIIAQFGYEKSRVDAQNPTLKIFYGWWSKQGDKFFSKGNLKKTAVMAAFGLPIGMAVGIVAGPVLGGGLAGAAALGSMRAISKGILGRRINRGAAAEDLAEDKALSQIEALKQKTDDLEARHEEMDAGYIDQLNSRLTKEAKSGNDREAMKAILIAGTAGAIGSVVMGALIGGVKPPWDCRITVPKPEPHYTADQVARDLFKGVSGHGPEATQNFINLLEQAKAMGVTPGPMNKGVEQLILNQMHGLQPGQAHQIGEVIGNLIAPQGGGIPHEWFLTGNNTELVTDLVRQGLSNQEIANQILTNYSGAAV